MTVYACLNSVTGEEQLQECKDLVKLLKQPLEEGDNDTSGALRKQLSEYFAGSRKEFTIPLVTPGTDFQQSVWMELLEIPYGTTRSYQEQAECLKTSLIR